MGVLNDSRYEEYIKATLRELRREIWKWYEELDEKSRKDLIEMIKQAEVK